ncbi:hypothetical protein Ocin01_15251 [Orchesella cincta]|uniref:Uncharacterized protein n=1 Tax=Orchesella cincta TaxID=48709 RepID=A0A1D2MF01_ORCCI|nr:hypothetical protein Ocin01_15251 [Orchesella cincta]
MPSSEIDASTSLQSMEDMPDEEGIDRVEKECSPPSPPENGTSAVNGNAVDNDNLTPSPSKRPCTGGQEEKDALAMEDGGDSSDEFDMGGFIRIRTQDDGIFEDEDDDDDFDYDFPIPEVEIQEVKPATTRKRKQDIMLREGDAAEIIDLEQEQYDDTVREPTYTIDPELFGARRRDRMPLYLLNPDDYAHDTKKQIQIRRAIITYRHHQDKKEQIIKLTDENKKLREALEAVRTKAVELSQCGCEKNITADLEVLDVKVPVVLPRMYVRGNRPVLAVPYNKFPISSDRFHSVPVDGLKSEPMPIPQSTSSVTVPTSIVTVGTSRMIQLTGTAPRAINISQLTTTSAAQPTRVLANGRVHTIRPAPAPPGLRPINRFLPPGAGQTTFRTIRLTSPLTTVIKTEPGVAANASISVNQTNTNATTPMTATVKVEGDGGGTMTNANRIVFAKRPATATTSATTTIPTASQLIFGQRLAVNTNPTAVKIEPTTAVPMTASQIAFANRLKQQNITLQQTPAKIIQHQLPTKVMQQPLTTKVVQQQQMPTKVLQQPLPTRVMQQPMATKVLQQQPTPTKVLQQPAPGQLFRTASGQVLRLVQAPAPGAVLNRPRMAGFQPILPKPGMVFNRPPPERIEEEPSKPFNPKDAEELWKKYEDDDDDELAIIAAINDTSPPPPPPTHSQLSRNRKQSMAQRMATPPESSKVNQPVPAAIEDQLELNKYADIVFEEAD